MQPNEIRSRMLNRPNPIAYVIVVTRARLDEDGKDTDDTFTEFYGPFTQAEVDEEAESDTTPTLFDPKWDRINCLEWEVVPLIFPNWLAQAPPPEGAVLYLQQMGATAEPWQVTVQQATPAFQHDYERGDHTTAMQTDPVCALCGERRRHPNHKEV